MWVTGLRGSGLQVFGAHDGTEALDPRSMARTYECLVEPLGGQETEPFFVTAGFLWRWDALLRASLYAWMQALDHLLPRKGPKR